MVTFHWKTRIFQSEVFLMKVKYTIDAYESLIGLLDFIESHHTQGAGIRWFDRYEKYLKKSLIKPEQIRKCNNETFHKLKMRCIYFNEWIIAFSIHEDFILIESLLHKSRIKD